MNALPLPARERRQPYLSLAAPERSRRTVPERSVTLSVQPKGRDEVTERSRSEDLSPSNFSNTEEASPLRCLECQGWDSSMPQNSLWGFCILRGQYLKRNEATGCERFLSGVQGIPKSPHSSLSSHSPPCLPLPPTPPPSKRRRRGDGSGYIQLHYHKSKKGKSYDQYYYHYEIWENGVRQIKSCAYIPKKKLPLIQSLEAEKAPVTRILQELGKLV